MPYKVPYLPLDGFLMGTSFGQATSHGHLFWPRYLSWAPLLTSFGNCVEQGGVRVEVYYAMYLDNMLYSCII